MNRYEIYEPLVFWFCNSFSERIVIINKKKVYLRHLNQDCISLLKNAEAVFDVNIMEYPTYNLVENKNKWIKVIITGSLTIYYIRRFLERIINLTNKL